MKEEIPFNHWSQSRISAGMKSCTSRHSKYPNDKRVTWISPKLPFWFIKQYLWMPEGATGPEELQKVINDIYNREVSGDEEFYVHFGQFGGI